MGLIWTGLKLGLVHCTFPLLLRTGAVIKLCLVRSYTCRSDFVWWITNLRVVERRQEYKKGRRCTCIIIMDLDWPWFDAPGPGPVKLSQLEFPRVLGGFRVRIPVWSVSFPPEFTQKQNYGAPVLDF